jgi:hypothetical protein
MGGMKMTLDLPNDLAKQVKLLAVHEDQKLKDTVAELLRRGLTARAVASPTVVKASKAMLDRRKKVGKKFISGEWGVALEGFEADRTADRKKAAELDQRWRK